MLTLTRSTVAYVLSYLVLMLPTYVLPYFGSNSALLGVMSSAVRGSLLPMPPWWMHVWCLVALIVWNWLRGNVVNKKYLAVFPFIAAFFDMTPGLSSIPLIRTVMHLIGLVLGAMGVAAIAEDETAEAKLQSIGTKGAIGIGLITVCAILGSIFSMTGLFNQFTKPAIPAAVKSEPAKAAALQAPNVVSQSPSVPAAKPTAVHRPRPPVNQNTNQAQAPKPTAASAAPAKPEVRYIKIND